MPNLDDVLTTRVNKKEYSKFRESCESVGLKPSFTVRKLMEEVSKGNIVLKIKVKQKKVNNEY